MQIFANADALLDVAADVVMSDATVRIAARGRFTLALSGGSTPQGLYRRLASEHGRHRIDWPRVHLFWGDERCVPPTDEASNYRMAREALIDHVPIPPAQVHRIHGEDPPNQAAARYDAHLRTTLGATGGGAGVLDLVLLGLGSRRPHGVALSRHDGAARDHTLVLARARRRRARLADHAHAPGVNAARAIVFLVAGRRQGRGPGRRPRGSRGAGVPAGAADRQGRRQRAVDGRSPAARLLTQTDGD